jgi:N-hydroxyarylamine O-acetyltransferase
MLRRVDDELIERVLSRLGFAQLPELDLHGLSQLYAAWGQRVPSDNLRKLVHLAELARGERPAREPLPGDTPEAFFADWLRYGCGGTCWAGNGALHALLRALGFESRRGIATMLVAPDLPPNHGTVAVALDRAQYLVDATMLFQAPLLLDDTMRTEVAERAWGVQCQREGEHFVVSWRPLHRLEPLRCRIEGWGMTPEAFSKRYEASRAWGPLNFAASLRVNRGHSVVGLGLGERVLIDEHGQRSVVPSTRETRHGFLIEDVGIAECLVSRLPEDRSLPPPPPLR